MKIQKQLEHKIAGRNSSCRGIVVADGKLYVAFVYDKEGFYESLIQCLDSSDFTILWEYSYRHVVFSMFISQQDTLILDFMNGQVKAFDLENGTVLWEFETQGTNIGIISNEMEGKVVVSGIHTGPTSWCIDTATGALRWKSGKKGHAYVPVIHGDKVYNTEGHEIFCLNFSDGALVWENREPETYLTKIHVFNQVVIATGHGILNFYDQSGKLLGTTRTGSSKAIGFIVSEEDKIYFGDEGGCFYCYQLEATPEEVKASQAWKIEMQAGITKPAIMEGHRLYIAVEDYGLLIVSKDSGEILLEKKIKGKGAHIAVDKDRIYFGGKVSLGRYQLTGI